MSVAPDKAKAQDDPRTMLAEDRTVLAAERTFAAWLRTGLAFLAAGLAVRRLLGDTLPGWAARLLASALLLCAVASFAAAAWRDGRVRARLRSPDIRLLPRVVTLGVVVLLIAMAAPSVVLVWLR